MSDPLPEKNLLISHTRALDLGRDEFWELQALGLSATQRELAPRVRTWLLSHQELLAPPEQVSSAPVDDSSPRGKIALEAAFCRDWELQQNAAETLDGLRVLAKVLERARALGGTTLPSPRLPNLTHLPLNPWALKNMPETLGRVRAWQKVLAVWIYDLLAPTQEISSEANPALSAFEVALLSAVLHGGLMHKHSLVALIRAFAPGEPGNLNNADSSPLREEAGRLSLRLALPWRGVPGAEHRIWYPDPLTGALLCQVSRDAGRPLCRPAENKEPNQSVSEADMLRRWWKRLRPAFRTALRQLNLNLALQPRRFTDLLTTVTEAAFLELPAVVVDYAQRRVRSHSLKPMAWNRLFGASPVPGNAATLDMAPAQEQASAWRPKDRTPAQRDLEPAWLRALRSALRGTQRRAIQQAVQGLLQTGTEPRIARWLVGFAQALLTEGSTAGHSLALSTVRGCTFTVARRFGCLLGEVDPAKFSDESFASLYTQILEDADPLRDHPGLRRNVARALYEFHHYLVRQEACPPIYWEVLGLRQGLLPVDANVVALEEYRQALALLDQRLDLSPEERRIARLLLILGFRCGLRRMEAFGLQVNDVCEDEPAELLIRPSALRLLKTKNATRKLPLSVLLTWSEGDELRAWKKDRAGWARADQPALWILPTTPDTPVSPERMVPVLHAALRQASSDPDLHYHHLRHSCATWTVWRLLMADFPAIAGLCTHRPETTAWLQEGPAFAAQLYGHQGVTRKHFWAVAALLGHGSPAITLEHYVHGMDTVLAAALADSPLFRPAKKLVCKVSGLPKSTFFSWQAEKGLASIPARLSRKLHPATRKHSRSPRCASATELVRPASLPWIEAAWHFLYHFETTPAFREQQDRTIWYERAEQYGFSPAQARAMLERARQLWQAKGPRGAARHHMKTVPDPRQAGAEKRLACPARYPPDQACVDRFAGRFPKLWQQDAAGVQQILDYYVKCVPAQGHRVPFTRVDEAGRYWQFLRQQLGLLQREVLFSTGKPAWWRRALSLTQRDRVERSSSRHILSLEIEPVFEPVSTGGAGFRFVMVMAYLVGPDLPQPSFGLPSMIID